MPALELDYFAGNDVGAAMSKDDFESLKRGMAQVSAYLERASRDGYITHTSPAIKATGAKALANIAPSGRHER